MRKSLAPSCRNTGPGRFARTQAGLAPIDHCVADRRRPPSWNLRSCPLRSRVPSDIELGIDFFQIRGQPEFDSEGHTDYKTERPCSRHNSAKRTDSAAE